MALASHLIANREFFEPGRGMPRDTWLDWIRRGVVQGKIIDGKPFVDIAWFAGNQEMKPPPAPASGRVTGLDLLARL